MQSSNKSMRVVHLSNVVGKFGGGVAQVVETLFWLQAKVGLETELWFRGKRSQESEVLVLDDCSEASTFAIQNLFFDIVRGFSRLRSFDDEHVIIHQHGVFLPISLLPLTSSKKVKVIISPHGFLEPEKMKVSALKKKFVLLLYEYWNLRRSSCLIACSQQEAIALRAFGFKQPVVVLPNGVDEAMVKIEKDPQDNAAIATRNITGGNKKVLLFLSRIHPFKGLELLLRAVLSDKRFFEKNNWVLVIAGIDELGHEQDLRKFVGDNGLSHLVFFVGPQYGSDKVSLLDSADCFILPSKGENFGIVVIEALARGVPVITTKSTPWEELNTRNCGWWVERSEESFRAVFADIFSKNDEEMSTMGLNGINLVKEKYTWTKIADQSLRIYRWVTSDFDKAHLAGLKNID